MEITTTNTKEKVLYLDMWNIIKAHNAVNTTMDENGNPIGAFIGTLNQIKIFVDLFKPKKVLAVFDGPEAGARRRSIHREYKNRSRPRSHVLLEGNSREELIRVDDMDRQLNMLMTMLKELPVTVVIIPYCEADDVIAHLCLKNKNEYHNIICSGDQDYCQIIQENISVYSWKKKILFDEERFLKDYKILPHNYIWQKITCGDSGDNYPGVKGVGDGTFLKWFGEEMKENKVENLADYVSIIESKEISGKTYQLLKESAKTLTKMYQLAVLDETLLSSKHLDFLKFQLEEQSKKQLHKMNLRIAFGKNSVNKGIRQEPFVWMQPFSFLNNQLELKY